MTEDTRAEVVRLVRADPTLSAEAIGDKLKISRQRAHLILRESGFQRVWQEWPPPGNGKRKRARGPRAGEDT